MAEHDKQDHHAYKVLVTCYDAFGKTVRHYAYGTNRAEFQAQGEILPRSISGGGHLYLHGYDLLYRGVVSVTTVHFTDGTTWKASRRSPAPTQEARMDQARNERGEPFLDDSAEAYDADSSASIDDYGESALE